MAKNTYSVKNKTKQIGVTTANLKKMIPWAITFLIFLAIIRIVSPSFFFKKLSYDVNDKAEESVFLQFDIAVQDLEILEKQKENIETIYTRYFIYNSVVYSEVEEKALAVIEAAESIAKEHDQPLEQKKIQTIKSLRQLAKVEITEEEAETLLEFSVNNDFRAILMRTIKHLLVERAVIEGLDFYKTFEQMNVVKTKIMNLNPPVPLKSDNLIDIANLNLYIENYLNPLIGAEKKQQFINLVSIICKNIIKPNIEFDKKSSSDDKNKKIKELKPIYRIFKKGDKIISGGDKISVIQYDAIQLINSRILYTKIFILLGTISIVLISFIIIAFYIKKLRPDFIFTTSNIIIITLPLLTSLFFERFLLNFLNFKETQFDAACFMFPIGAIGMLAVVFLEARVAFLLVIWSAMMMGIVLEEFTSSFWFVLYYWISGLAAVAFLYTIKERKDILMAGMKLSLINAVLIIIINLIKNPGDFQPNQIVWGVSNGIFCIMLTFPGITFFENMFGFVTDIKLLELTGIKQKVLKDFEEKAPGSYQHTLNVAKLADSAAETIGARYLLARAGAYYHDLGKMTKPQYYSENQVTPEDKKAHSKLSPHMSTLIIKNHIREGIELAKKYNVPKRIAAFIPEHHGTGLIKYFYHQALQNFENSDTADVVREEDFRYPGPKPQSIEAAIVMLADSVEATVTAKLTKPYVTDDDIRLVVRDTIRDKFNDGQFDECNLTLKDLHRISESFVKTLRSRFHHRIDYPKAPQSKEQ